jgi:ubiquitin carboxyl-terminal hydrolase 5/13
MTSLSASKQSEIKAWEEEITACEHTRNLEQDPPKKLESQGESNVILVYFHFDR